MRPPVKIEIYFKDPVENVVLNLNWFESFTGCSNAELKFTGADIFMVCLSP